MDVTNSIKSEDFIRSFIYNLININITEVEYEPEKTKYLIEKGGRTDPSLGTNKYLLIWANTDTTELDLVRAVAKSGHTYYYKKHIQITHCITIVNRKWLDSTNFWPDVLDIINNIGPLYKGPVENLIKNSTVDLKTLQKTQKEVHKLKINSAITDIPDTVQTRFEKKIDTITNEIHLRLTEIADLKNQIKVLKQQQIDHILKPGKSNPVSQLITYLDKCKAVRAYCLNINNNNVNVDIMLKPFPISYTAGDQALQKLVYESAKTTNYTEQAKNALYDALGEKLTYTVIHKPIFISIQFNLSDSALKYTIVENDRLYYPNSNNEKFNNLTSYSDTALNLHWFKYNCLGQFKIDLIEAKQEMNPVRLFATLLQYLSTINIADVAGQYWLYSSHILLDHTTNSIYMLDTAQEKIDITSAGITFEDYMLSWALPSKTYYIKEN